MKNLTGHTIYQLTGGTSLGELPSGELTAVVTDSREAAPGCLFAAIGGEHADGHDYIAQAGERGAACALCERFVAADLPQLRVPDTQAALRQIAAYYRKQFDIPFIGVTGSVGKTTAKEMIAAVLSARYQTHKTRGNFNNELGVPLTLFGLRPEHEAAVIEMGISGFGEMTRLTEMVRPTVSVFTVIGDAHLETLGDRAGVLRAKAEIVSGMPRDGLVLANGDDPCLAGHDFGRRTRLYGLGDGCGVRAVEVRHNWPTDITCVITDGARRVPVRIPGVGEHMLYAALAGAAVGMELGMTDEQIARGVASYEAVGGRSRLVDTGYLMILDDCYNANPSSVRNALTTLSGLGGRLSRRRVAVLGDMLELGENGPALHRQVGRWAAEDALVVACGPMARQIAGGAGEGAVWFPDTAALIAALPSLLRQGDIVLVKASHGMGFAAVVEYLEKYRQIGPSQSGQTLI